MNKMLGFIGMGHMGSHMTSRLIGAGYSVIVYDRSKEKSRAIAGSRVADSPKDLAADSEVLLVSVTDDAAVEQVMFRPDGALAGLRNGSLIIG